MCEREQKGPSNTGGSGPGNDIFNHPAPEGHGKTLSAVLGEIVWLMSQSTFLRPIAPLLETGHKQFFISDLEWPVVRRTTRYKSVMTPVLLKQFRLFYAKDRPLGVIFWGFVSDEVEERLQAGTTKLRPQDWKSGDKLWVVEVIAPFGGAEEMVKDLKEKVFKEREIRFVAMGKEGKKEVRAV